MQLALQAAVPAPNGDYPRATMGATQSDQSDESLIANVETAFHSAYGASLNERNSAAANSMDAYMEQRYCNMVSLIQSDDFFPTTSSQLLYASK